MSEIMKSLKSFNVLLPDTGASQLSYCVINGLNKLCLTNPEIDCVVFYENQHKNCLPANFSIMQIFECWGSSEPIIATTISTAKKLLHFPCRKKLFYVWDLEWIREPNTKKYEDYSDVYANKSIELIARSESHKEIIENAFNRPVKYIVPDFETSKILEILNG